MPRNGSGSYTLPQAAFVPGTTISSSAVNNDFSDIAQTLTTSIASDGQTPITGPLKQDSGILTAPPWTFTSDTSAGMFLPGTGILGLVAGSQGLFLNSAAKTATAATPSATGGSYVVGDTITLTGGTFTRAAVLQVATLSGSAIASVTVLDGGAYTTIPTNPVSQGSTSGGGSGATFTVTWGAAFTISNEAGTQAFSDLGASSYMAGLMSTVSAAALQSSLLGTTVSATVSSNQNDYAPSGVSAALVLRLNATTAVTITGINAASSFAGRQVTIENVGTGSITLTTQDTNSSAANRFAFVTPIIIQPNQSLTLIYDTTSLRWRSRNPINAPAIVQNRSNLKITNDAGTPNAIMDITCDALLLGDSFGDTYRATAVSVSPNITVSGVNGLDTGTKTNSTWYSIWVIYNPTTNTVAGLFSTASVIGSVVLPSGYTFYARVGWNFINSSGNFMGILQFGSRVQYVFNLAGTVKTTIATGTPAAWTAVSVLNIVPTATASRIFLSLSGVSNAAVAAPNNSYSTVFSNTTSPPPMAMANLTGGNGGNVYGEFALESTNVYWGGAGATSLSCLGWEDNL